MKKIILLLAAVLFLVALNVHAQSTNDPQAELKVLLDRIHVKIVAGRTNEADYAAELKDFDKLIAEQNGAKTDDAAQLVYLKATIYLQLFNDTDKGKAIIQQIKTDYPDTSLGKSADEILAGIDAQIAAKKKQDAMLATGLPFPDFAEKDVNGNPISVATLKGKVVLLDFWATWCVPCRETLPDLIATYKKHHADGFEIIGVSLDSERGELDSFLKKADGMTWPQYFDGQGWKNKLALKYEVQGIPFDVLIGRDGKIIGKSLLGDALENAVAAALARK